MLRNRSIPNVTIIPELAYPDTGAAADWLCRAFGFTVRLRIANHRVQLNAGDGAMVAIEGKGGGGSVLMRVDDVDSHHEHAKRAGAKIVRPPAYHPYGEKQYTAEDCGGHCWTFSQSTSDVAPEVWGGEAVNLTK